METEGYWAFVASGAWALILLSAVVYVAAAN
jgi:hypothetical protein